MAQGVLTLGEDDLTEIKDTKGTLELIVTVWLGETIQIDGGHKGTDGSDHLLTGYVRRKGGVDRLSLDENRDGALRVLGEERVRTGLAVDEAEVSAFARVFSAGGAVADGGCFQVLRGAIVEERA